MTSPALSEALRAEIRAALEADGQPFNVNVARRVYDIAIAARDLLITTGNSVGDAIAQVEDTKGPMDNLDTPDTIESQALASETFGARLIREVVALLPTLSGQNARESPKALVQALATARERGLTDVANELEVQLFGRPISANALPPGDVLAPPAPPAPTHLAQGDVAQEQQFFKSQRKRMDTHYTTMPHDTCNDPARCDCECRVCKRTWYEAGRPGPDRGAESNGTL